jgi:hypothetical protein
MYLDESSVWMICDEMRSQNKNAARNSRRSREIEIAEPRKKSPSETVSASQSCGRPVIGGFIRRRSPSDWRFRMIEYSDETRCRRLCYFNMRIQ